MRYSSCEQYLETENDPTEWILKERGQVIDRVGQRETENDPTEWILKAGIMVSV